MIPASILIGAAFSAAGLAATAYLRTVQDFDLPMGLVVMPMFLFSGTFFPISLYPQPIQLAMELTPLFHGVGLVRGLATGLHRAAHGPWDCPLPGRLLRDLLVHRHAPDRAQADQVVSPGSRPSSSGSAARM